MNNVGFQPSVKSPKEEQGDDVMIGRNGPLEVAIMNFLYIVADGIEHFAIAFTGNNRHLMLPTESIDKISDHALCAAKFRFGYDLQNLHLQCKGNDFSFIYKINGKKTHLFVVY